MLTTRTVSFQDLAKKNAAKSKKSKATLCSSHLTNPSLLVGVDLLLLERCQGRIH